MKNRFEWASSEVSLWLLANVVANVFSEYCVFYAVRKTSAFTFTCTLAFTTPMTFFSELAMHHFGWISTLLRWNFWYLFVLAHIMVGCILSYFKSENDSAGKKDCEKIDDTQSKVQTMMDYNSAKETNIEITPAQIDATPNV